MKKILKLVSVLLVFAVMLGAVSVSAAEATPSDKALSYLKAEFEAGNYDPEAYPDYDMAIALRTSAQKDNYDYKFLIREVKSADVSSTDALALTRAIMNLILAGIDPTNFESRNLVKELIALQDTEIGGFFITEQNGTKGSYLSQEAIAIWAIELANLKYAAGQTAYRAGIIKYFKDCHLAGGFGYSSDSEYADDTTVSILIAQKLMGDTNAPATLQNVVDTFNDESGFFEFYGPGSGNANTQAMCIIALALYFSENGTIDTDTLPISGEKALTALIGLQGENGGFNYNHDENDWQGNPVVPDMFSTKQALWAINLLYTPENFFKLFSSEKYTALAAPVVPPPSSSTVSPASSAASSAASDNQASASSTDFPAAGDQSGSLTWLFIVIGIVALVAVVGAVVLPKINKKKDNDENDKDR